MISHLTAIAAGAGLVILVQRTWRRVIYTMLSRGDT